MRRSLAPSQSSISKKARCLSGPWGCDENEASAVSSRQVKDESLRSAVDVLKLVGLMPEQETSAQISDSVHVAEAEAVKCCEEDENKRIEVKTSESKDDVEKYFKVLWCKRSTRKHKKWEGDAVLVVKNRSVILKDMDGKVMGRALGYKQSQVENLEDGSELVVGGKEIQVMNVIPVKEYESGACFIDESRNVLQPSQINSIVKKPFCNPSKVPTPALAAVRPSFTPKYNPLTPGALVMPRPTSLQQFEKDELIVDVVVDPALASKLRPHQKEGVIFLYECLTQLRDFNGQGAILADDMGLGKTLQCIAVIWTMLKQGPYAARPLVKRVLIITPSSLMKNWLKEFNVWLGQEKLRVCLANQTDRLEAYCKSPSEPVVITSYELAMRHHELLEKVKFDVMICDEGHRLKNTNTKTATFLGGLSVKRRIALTGTPIQNDLQELYSLVDFINPGILGSMSCFKKIYEEPIVESKQPSASTDEIHLGELRSSELSRLTSQFILRRTQDVNNKYLPSKTEYVVFCKPSQLQADLYKKVLASRTMKSCLKGTCKESSFHLVCISCLKKLCNHPQLIFEAAKEASELPPELSDDSPYAGLVSSFPQEFQKSCIPASEFSGKLLVLTHILNGMKSLKPKERVVLVSNSTKTLNILETMCKVDQHSYFRLDGSTPLNNRQDLVDRFNSKFSDTFVFLLSSKAGGVGLNLVGASRLILFDIDWNPANDLQAMSRVWRDGQNKHVHIYRLLTTGTIEEKIYQRQVTKQSLNTVLAKSSRTKMQFSIDDLRDLFTFSCDCQCDTHDLMGCECSTSIPASPNDVVETAANRSAQLTVEKMWNKSKNLSIDELMCWKHVSGHCVGKSLQNSCLEEALKDGITFLFYNVVNERV